MMIRGLRWVLHDGILVAASIAMRAKIGSNDLTQLVLGLDRDSGTVAYLFDERDDAVRDMIAEVIQAAKVAGKPIGICGQAPSDYPDFAHWLVERGIDSISLNPDTAIKTTLVIAQAEAQGVRQPTFR
jgi:pyruvate,water dikinase